MHLILIDVSTFGISLSLSLAITDLLIFNVTLRLTPMFVSLYPNNHIIIKPTKNEGALIPNTVANTNILLSKNEFLRVAVTIPKAIPIIEAIIIAVNAKTVVSGKVSVIISDTLRFVI